MSSNLLEKDQFLWVEKYRPQTVADCILPDRIKTSFQQFVDKKQIPHLILAGTAGVGKTTIAKALCNEVGCDFLFINGSNESGIDTFRNKIMNYASGLSLDGGRKVIIIDEADYLNPNSTQPALRSAMEEFAENCTIIFTCNYKNKIIAPLHSRCTVIDFQLHASERQAMAMGFFNRARDILVQEGITEIDLDVLAKLIEKYFPDYRRIINELQRYSANGKIDIGILASIKDLNYKSLVDAMKAKNFKDMRKWVAMNVNDDPERVYTRLYQVFNEELKPEYTPRMIVTLAKYAYQRAFVADQELNLVAGLAEILLECEFK